jgi:cytochrome c551/c552
MTDPTVAPPADSPWDGFFLGAAVGATTTLLIFGLVLAVGWDQLTGASADDSVAAQPTTLAPIGPPSGEALAQVAGCTACHSVDGSDLVGPSWLGIAGTDRPIEGGGTVLADRGYLHESIVDPSGIIVADFPDVMPKTFGDSLSDEEIEALIDYIESLG